MDEFAAHLLLLGPPRSRGSTATERVHHDGPFPRVLPEHPERVPSSEAMDAEARGEIALGGCIIPWEPLHYRCLACNCEWGRPEEPGEAGPV